MGCAGRSDVLSLTVLIDRVTAVTRVKKQKRKRKVVRSIISDRECVLEVTSIGAVTADIGISLSISSFYGFDLAEALRFGGQSNGPWSGVGCWR